MSARESTAHSGLLKECEKKALSNTQNGMKIKFFSLKTNDMKLTVNCPKCNTQTPSVRIPTSFHQLLWGGCTCKKCGINMDRNGKEIGMKK
jgi:hypothetical protein|tara:strand:- start:158 stop:430 length:273 start_codon:yes stop_codon:yes gene_type:complete